MSPEMIQAAREHIARRWLARRHRERTILLAADEHEFRYVVGGGLPRRMTWAALPLGLFEGMQSRDGKVSIALYTLTRDIPDHPMGSTVSEATLLAAEVRP